MKPSFVPIVATFDRLADTYGTRGGMEEVNRKEIAPVIKEWEGRILDVGCGAGNLIQKYVDPGKREIFSIDFSENMIRETIKRIGRPAEKSVFIVRSVAQALPFQDNCFDGVLSVNTLHNMPSRLDVFQAVVEMARVLKPGGLLLTEFRNSNHPERKRISELYDRKELPQKVFTVRDVSEILDRIGFTLEKVVPLTGDEPPGGRLSKTLKKMEKTFHIPAWRAPRFAVVSRKGEGFSSLKCDQAGFPLKAEFKRLGIDLKGRE